MTWIIGLGRGTADQTPGQKDNNYHSNKNGPESFHSHRLIQGERLSAVEITSQSNQRPAEF
jgi:hypothetical protein